MSSTAWFWYTMLTAMLMVSRSGRISVGPKTMPMFWVVMRFVSECSITLSIREIERERQQSTERLEETHYFCYHQLLYGQDIHKSVVM